MAADSGDRGGQFLDDGKSLEALVGLMLPRERAEYKSYGALSIEAAFPNRYLVAYTLQNGQPVDQTMLRLGDITIDRVNGPEVVVAEGSKKVRISCVPTRWGNRDLFLHVPQNFTLKWSGKQVPGSGVQFVPHYAVLIKTRSKELRQIEGHTYCATLNKFRERFPGFLDKVRY